MAINAQKNLLFTYTSTILKLCFVVFNFLLCSFTFSSQLKVELRSHVELSRKEVVLGDIADVTSDNLLALQKVAGIRMGYAPRLGTELVLTREMIAGWVARHLKGSSLTIKWEGPIATKIVVATQEIQAEKLVENAQEKLLAYLKEWGTSNEVHVLKFPSEVLVPNGRVKLSTRALNKGSYLPKRVSMFVDVFVDDQFIRTVPISFEVNVFQSAWKLIKDYGVRESINPDDLVIDQIQIAGLAVLPLESKAWMNKMRAKLPLKKGQILLPQFIEELPLAQKGEWVTLKMKMGGVELESRVEVLRDGGVGQIIPVKGSNTSGIVMAKVIGLGKVEMNL